MKIIKKDVHDIDLSHLVDNIIPFEHKKLLMAPAGHQHYKLLTYLTRQINNATIVELGTHSGTSSTCLCENVTNKVKTFDIVDVYAIKNQPNNLTRHIGNIFKLDPSILLKTDLVFLDTAHQGDFETEIYLYLKNNKYNGILLLDDIFFNEKMTQFWDSIDEKKHDITSVGHGHYGTGIVDFNNNVSIHI